ncbi:MAG: methyltransferase domain-containing protein, partial [Oscillospiraceae bacterium]|nr:methyltransferase domain-containing protein [Oscillospiraceae bacterium]
LRKAMAALALELADDKPVILDSGCGEGWYTQGIYEALTVNGKMPRVVGIDISKEAVRLASKRLKNAEFAVASAYRLPVLDESADVLFNCFSPLCEAEFLSVLKKDGYFVYVVPAPRHLWELKCALYDRPYENERASEQYDGFELTKTLTVEDRIALPDSSVIRNLFKMTPYFWKTSREDAARLEALEKLETEISFDIYVYRK